MKRAKVAEQHRVAVKAVDSIKDDLAAIDRALHLCGYICVDDRINAISDCRRGLVTSDDQTLA